MVPVAHDCQSFCLVTCLPESFHFGTADSVLLVCACFRARLTKVVPLGVSFPSVAVVVHLLVPDGFQVLIGLLNGWPGFY